MPFFTIVDAFMLASLIKEEEEEEEKSQSLLGLGSHASFSSKRGGGRRISTVGRVWGIINV